MSSKSRKNKQQETLASNNLISPASRPISSFSPGEESRSLLQISRQQQITQSFSGPLPPPSVLREYNEIIPGLADRIVALAEKQTEHRIGIETKIIESDISQSRAGLVCGITVAIMCVGAGMTCILYGHDWAGTTLATGAVGGLVYTFIYGTASRKAERTEKAKMMAGQTGTPATTPAIANKPQ
jgi:uncharacterized membrane protein